VRKVAGYSLWLGHVGDARDLKTVLAAGIVAMVDLAINEPPTVVTREMAYVRFPLVDGIGNSPWLLRSAVDVVTAFLRSNVPTLVYCSTGLGRTLCVAGAAVARLRDLAL
jgi:protein-tyrosine phosphatase